MKLQKINSTSNITYEVSRELTSSEFSGKGGMIRKTVVRLSSLYRNEPHDEELGNPEPVPGHGE